MLYPVVRSRLRAAVGAVLVSGHEHAPETHQPAAHVSEEEEDGYTGGAASRTAQVLTEVIKDIFFYHLHDSLLTSLLCRYLEDLKVTTVQISHYEIKPLKSKSNCLIDYSFKQEAK